MVGAVVGLVSVPASAGLPPPPSEQAAASEDIKVIDAILSMSCLLRAEVDHHNLEILRIHDAGVGVPQKLGCGA
jgi:hypothetical protein